MNSAIRGCRFVCAAVAIGLMFTAGRAVAQQTTGTRCSPAATTTVDPRYLPNPPEPC